MNLLIVDGNSSMQQQLLGWLEMSGHTVTVADCAETVREAVHRGATDVILSEWNSTILAGPELCLIVRKRAAPCYLIAYSDTDELDFAICTAAGADDILSTPVTRTQLQVRILAAERALKLQRAFAQQNDAHRILNEKLDQAYKTLHAELQQASALQLSLLPVVSEVHPKFSLDWLVLPSSFLAGDNLNYFMMQERYLIFYHLDVAGHGIPSALLSVTLNQLLSPQPGSPMVRFDPKLELKRIVPPVEVVSELNRRFQPQGDGYFTMIYAVLDTKTREIRLCQAGHPSPLKICADGTTCTVGDGGFPVGLWPGMTYEETRTKLMPGDLLVLYSDGVLACVNDKGEPYSLEQLERVIRSKAGQPLKQVLEAVKIDLERWSRGRDFPDDISMLVIESK